MCFRKREKNDRLIRKIDVKGMPSFGKFNFGISVLFLIGFFAFAKPDIFDSLNKTIIVIKGLLTNVSFDELIALTGINDRSLNVTNWVCLGIIFFETMGCMIFTFFAEKENRK